jgi:hypothetical protein
MDTKTTIHDLFLETFRKGNEEMIAIIDSGTLENFKHTTYEFLKEQAKVHITQKLIKDLQEKTGDRMKIIRFSMAETPFNYHFLLIYNLWSKKCKKNKHLYYYLSSDRDGHESESYYACIYCRKEGTKSRRSSLDGEIARTTHKPGEKLETGKRILAKLITTNPTDKEIKEFANTIIDLAF